ncbi:uncharacterized protein METZ01_LOCUS214686, partial [marine metagenome]
VEENESLILRQGSDQKQVIAVSGNESHSLFPIKLTREVINNVQRSVKLHYNHVFPLMATWAGR